MLDCYRAMDEDTRGLIDQLVIFLDKAPIPVELREELEAAGERSRRQHVAAIEAEYSGQRSSEEWYQPYKLRA